MSIATFSGETAEGIPYYGAVGGDKQETHLAGGIKLNMAHFAPGVVTALAQETQGAVLFYDPIGAGSLEADTPLDVKLDEGEVIIMSDVTAGRAERLATAVHHEAPEVLAEHGYERPRDSRRLALIGHCAGIAVVAHSGIILTEQPGLTVSSVVGVEPMGLDPYDAVATRRSFSERFAHLRTATKMQDRLNDPAEMAKLDEDKQATLLKRFKTRLGNLPPLYRDIRLSDINSPFAMESDEDGELENAESNGRTILELTRATRAPVFEMFQALAMRGVAVGVVLDPYDIVARPDVIQEKLDGWSVTAPRPHIEIYDLATVQPGHGHNRFFAQPDYTAPYVGRASRVA